MLETCETICAWADASFGTGGSDYRCAVRALEEAVELQKSLASDPRHPKAPEEAADVVIVLCRVAMRRGLGLSWAIRPRFTGSPTENAAAISNALSWICNSLALGISGPGQESFDALVQNAAWICYRFGTDLATEIDAKMATNRAREWKLDGTGHGYHVRAERSATADLEKLQAAHLDLLAENAHLRAVCAALQDPDGEPRR